MSPRFPESAVFYRTLARELPLAVRGDGAWIHADDGRSWLDASGGAAVANLGHGGGYGDEIAAAVSAAIRGVGYLNGTQFTHESAEALAAELAKRSPGDLDFAYFLSSGSEAIEAAVKLARQVQLERGHAGKWKVISRVPSYHGNTLAALSLSAREHYRRDYRTAAHRLPARPGARSLSRSRRAALHGAGARGGDRAPGPGDGRGVPRRADRRLVVGRRRSRGRLLGDRQRDLPSPRRAAHRR